MRLGAHNIGRYYHCAEQPRIRYIEKVQVDKTKTIKRGTEYHKRNLERHIKEYKNLKRLLESLAPYRNDLGFFERQYKEHSIGGDPDWFAQRNLRRISLFEEKHITSKTLGPFRVPPASLQLRTYCFIMEPIFKDLGFSLYPTHKLFYFYQRTGEPLAIRDVTYNEELYLQELDKVIRVVQDQENPIPPNPSKCLRCAKNYREKCRIYAIRGGRPSRKRKSRFLRDEAWGHEWELELRRKLLAQGHAIVNEDGRHWVSQALGGIKGLDFACARCGLWFESKRKRSPFIDLSYNLKPYETFKVWLCFKTTYGEFYVDGKEIVDNLKEATPLRNRYGEPFYRWRKRSVFKSLRKTPPKCEVKEI